MNQLDKFYFKRLFHYKILYMNINLFKKLYTWVHLKYDLKTIVLHFGYKFWNIGYVYVYRDDRQTGLWTSVLKTADIHI